jgi:prevent-host-death family protein
MDRTMSASRFKAQCLALLDEVAESGESLLITKRGQPVARLAPVHAPASLRGSVTFVVGDEELIAPLPERWDAA